ncbi:YdeI/OmpD-associated family protein [Pontibacter chitinilyticus]|uniref:YdeI/OmpD-associated family protein n=1 Tax=Pontibacter chitinilyticus TaxID=2674989 RepID=UPI0032196083
MMPDLGKKLQLKPAYSLLLLQAPPAIAETLLTEGYTITVATGAATEGMYDAVLLFVSNKQQLQQLAPQAVTLIKPEGMLWVAYPKKASGITTDLTRDEGWKLLAELGYGPVRQVSVDEMWSGLRFKHQSEQKAASQFGVDQPGIDRKTKTVILPEDLQLALEEAHLLDTFQQLAFTHRKEFVVAVLDAKRPETRRNRISKTVEQLQALAEKSGKV